MWRTILQVVGLIAAILSLIPLIGADYWWIRVYDFLHMYFTAFTLIAIIIYFFKFKPGWARDYLYIGILCAAIYIPEIRSG